MKKLVSLLLAALMLLGMEGGPVHVHHYAL